MRNILLIFLAIFTLNVSAQERKMKRKGNDFTPEQVAELQTKRLALALDLSEAQKKEIYNLNLADAKERKQKMEERKALKEKGKDRKELSSDEKFEKANEQLDKKLAKKEAMKRILNEEQFAKWEKLMQEKGKQRKMKAKKTKMHRMKQSDK